MKKLFLFLCLTLALVACFSQMTLAETSASSEPSFGDILTAPLERNQQSLEFFVVSSQEKIELMATEWSVATSPFSVSLAIVISHNIAVSDFSETLQLDAQNAATALVDQASKIGLQTILMNVSTDAQRTAINEATEVDNDLYTPMLIVAIGYPTVDAKTSATGFDSTSKTNK